MNILSIETSCDETAAAIVAWSGNRAQVLANTVSSQASLHAKWGGVVPDLAAREHIRNIVPVIEETLTRASMKPADIDLIAVTKGPGLMPALVVGVSAAKTLALLWKKPLIGIQHLEGHIYANLLREDTVLRFPLIALIVSGGHTELVLMQRHFDYTVLGETQDDASGEAFDKVAKLLGLTYPGGPEIAKRADEYRIKNQESEIKEITEKFPRPMLNSDDFNFSFSGLKTSVLYSLKKEDPAKLSDEQFVASMCHAFQEAVVDVLVGKTKKALALYAPQTFVIAGGVSANVRLRNRLRNLIDTDFPKTEFLTPEFAYSLDNAAMIGIAAAIRYEHMNEAAQRALMDTALTLDPDANLPLQMLANKASE
ncbi:MAG: tRNA (adenosine(37)-N6)-threonylcarbamoyltransferase complex transferase subunit TsaD [Candidatus Moranbacteria bacterium RIFCSPHIGHO2_01_FULL_54_31]|nr:MAG: tRNA (adenosine(37)-N6)-threonylcarbamoyltransferase complex transferase subunit TsaD [Candidatus Moranbacteria bacterium RIFCSPHIGHO2_01_FULL_54_31]